MGWISAIASLAGTVASGVGSALANKSEKEQIERERGAMNHWYNQQIYQDPTKRADYAAMMNQMKLALRKKNEVEDNKRTVLGGTQESALAMQQQNADAVANVAEQQMADQAKRVDMLNQQKRSEDFEYNKQQAALRARQFETWGNVAGNAAQAFGGFDAKGGGDKTSDAAEQTTGLSPEDSGNFGLSRQNVKVDTGPTPKPQAGMQYKQPANHENPKVSVPANRAPETGLETAESIRLREEEERRKRAKAIVDAGLRVIGNG